MGEVKIVKNYIEEKKLLFGVEEDIQVLLQLLQLPHQLFPLHSIVSTQLSQPALGIYKCCHVCLPSQKDMILIYYKIR